jgi:uncharacterized protein with HEPN domain
LSPRLDAERLADMRAAIEDICALTERDKEGFETDRYGQQAVAYNLAVLGEAARALSSELRGRYPDVQWSDVIAQRNVVVHAYHTLDVEDLWVTAKHDVPRLGEQLAAIEAAERDRS